MPSADKGLRAYVFNLYLVMIWKGNSAQKNMLMNVLLMLAIPFILE